MDERKQPKIYYETMRGKILAALADGKILTTEEIRFAAGDTLNVVWSQMRRLQEAGLIEGNRPKKHLAQRKWRARKPEPATHTPTDG